MNRQKFLAELSRLLGFMSSWDREAEMNKYIEMFDAAEDEAALIESVGTPTQIAISVALGYKSTPRPGTQPPEPEPEPEPESVEQPAPEPESAPVPPVPPKKKRGKDEIVTDVEFDYGMELALLMGEPVASAVESAFKGEYLPDPELSLDEILREARGGGSAQAEAGPEAAEAGAAPGAAPAEESAGAAPETAEESEEEHAAEAKSAPDTPSEEAAPPESESAGPEPGDAEALAPEGEPEEASGTGDEKAPEAGESPVFDAATAPLPETVKSAGNADAEEKQPAGDAGAPETEAKHPPHLVFDPANFAPLPEDQATDDGDAGEAESTRAARRPAGIAVYVLFSLVIGIPVSLLMILIGVPVLLLGLGVIAGTVYAATHIIAALSMFSDILLVVGAGLAISAVGLLITWLGLWLSIELGSLWINAVMLRLGRALCFKREADA